MTKSKKILFIVLQFLSGIGFGILGAYIFFLFDNGEFFDSIFYGIVVGFGSVLLGIGLVGYFYLKQINKLGDFVISMVLSLVGLVMFFLLYMILQSLIQYLISYNLDTTFLSILLPIIGGLIGFNFKTRNVTRETTRNDS